VHFYVSVKRLNTAQVKNGQFQYRFYFILLGNRKIYKEILTFVDQFMALYFTAIDTPPAARCIQILPMNQ
jgi:hypothetical protein